MGKKILVDTDILIKVYRGDQKRLRELQSFKGGIFISVITALEFLNGAKSLKQFAATKKELKSYQIIHLNQESPKKQYSFSQNTLYNMGQAPAIYLLQQRRCKTVLNYIQTTESILVL